MLSLERLATSFSAALMLDVSLLFAIGNIDNITSLKVLATTSINLCHFFHHFSSGQISENVRYVLLFWQLELSTGEYRC